MRKSIDRLAAIVESKLSLSALESRLFVFCSEGRDRIKLLYWEQRWQAQRNESSLKFGL